MSEDKQRVGDGTLKRALVCLFVLLYVPFLFQQGYRRASEQPGDFPTLYWGAKMVFDEGRSPYVDGAFDEVARREQRRIFPYLYPPPSLLCFYPFSTTTYDAAKVRLIVVNHVCLLVILYLLFLRIRPFEPPPAWRLPALALMTVYVLNYYPVADNFAWGQINLVVLALVCFAWLALKRGGRALSIAVPLSLSILLKTYPFLLLPLLVIRKRYAAAAWTLALVALYGLVSWWVLPKGLWGDWLANVAPTGGYGLRPFNLPFIPVEPWNHSINGFMLFVQDRSPEVLGVKTGLMTRPLTYLLAGAVGAATLGLALLSARKGRAERTLDADVSLFLLMMFLVAPLSWEHHLVYALPAALVAIDFLLKGPTRLPAAAGALAALFLLAWELPRDDWFYLQGVLGLSNALKFFAALGLWLFVAKRMWDDLKESSSQET
ncbi:MAG TPA: glycosyltransferase family 87 protein, partial [Pyrinomonadaceae bacterium]